MLSDVFRQLRGVVADVRQEANHRRRVTQYDAIADTMAWCAEAFEAKITEIESGLSWLTAEEYAEDVGTSPQSVRTWCRNGELEAEKTPNGWQIRRGTTRKRKERAA